MKHSGIFRRRTKIVCTIGPAADSAEAIERLIKAGMNVARLNLAHGEPGVHTRYIKTLRKVSRRSGVNLAILIDLPGPKYRTGRLKDGQVTLKRGGRLTLTTRDVAGDASLVPVNLPTL